MEEVRSSSSEEDCQDAALQVHHWRFSELETTDLATLREVDLCVPFQFPSIDSAHWKNYVPFPSKRPPLKRKREWRDAVTAHWASHKGLAVAANKNKSPFNGAWSKLCFNQPGDPTPEALIAVRCFPLNLDNGKVVTYQEVSHTAKALWRAPKAKLAELNETPIPSGTPPRERQKIGSSPMSPTAPHSLPGRWRPTPRARAIALPGVRWRPTPVSVAALASRASHRGDNQNAWQ